MKLGILPLQPFWWSLVQQYSISLDVRWPGWERSWGEGGQMRPGELPRMLRMLGSETNPALLAPYGCLAVLPACGESGPASVTACPAMGGSAHSRMGWQLCQGFLSL